jgi:hypothetical protein
MRYSMTKKKKSLTYYAIQYGGVPMTFNGAKQFLMMANLGGYTIDEAIKLVPNEFRSDKYKNK